MQILGPKGRILLKIKIAVCATIWIVSISKCRARNYKIWCLHLWIQLPSLASAQCCSMSFFIELYNHLGWKGSQGHVVQSSASQKSSFSFFSQRTPRLRIEFIVVRWSYPTAVFHPWRNRLSTQDPKERLFYLSLKPVLPYNL